MLVVKSEKVLISLNVWIPWERFKVDLCFLGSQSQVQHRDWWLNQRINSINLYHKGSLLCPQRFPTSCKISRSTLSSNFSSAHGMLKCAWVRVSVLVVRSNLLKIRSKFPEAKTVPKYTLIIHNGHFYTLILTTIRVWTKNAKSTFWRNLSPIFVLRCPSWYGMFHSTRPSCLFNLCRKSRDTIVLHKFI